MAPLDTSPAQPSPVQFSPAWCPVPRNQHIPWTPTHTHSDRQTDRHTHTHTSLPFSPTKYTHTHSYFFSALAQSPTRLQCSPYEVYFFTLTSLCKSLAMAWKGVFWFLLHLASSSNFLLWIRDHHISSCV